MSVRQFIHKRIPCPNFFTGGSDRHTWIDLCQKAEVDPREVIEKHLDRLIALVLEASLAKTKVS